MKKTTIALAVALAGFATVAQAAPKDDTFYVGGKYGWAHYFDTSLRDHTSAQKISARADDMSYGAFGGYQVNPYLGFELGYDWLGRVKYHGPDNGAFKSQGFQAAAKLSYPIYDDLDIYTRLGGMAYRADSSFKYRGESRHKDHHTGVAPLAAIGVEYAITKDWATRLDYQYINNVGKRSETNARPDSTTLTLGVSYRFGQDDTAPVVVTPAPVVKTKHFTLKSDVLFNFNKSTLKPQGQQALDQLYTQLNSLDPKDGSVVVLGYTDRIGSDKYNNLLSEKRAQSVVDYLVSKGIPSDKISARGMGKSNPTTGSTCDNITHKAALIECLSPDRRVEIEVKGIREQVVNPK